MWLKHCGNRCFYIPPSIHNSPINAMIWNTIKLADKGALITFYFTIYTSQVCASHRFYTAGEDRRDHHIHTAWDLLVSSIEKIEIVNGYFILCFTINHNEFNQVNAIANGTYRVWCYNEKTIFSIVLPSPLNIIVSLDCGLLKRSSRRHDNQTASRLLEAFSILMKLLGHMSSSPWSQWWLQ